MRLLDKVAIITGSTRGIGEAIVHLFYSEGAKVVITGRDEAKGLSIKKELMEQHVIQKPLHRNNRCIFVKTDVSVKDDVLSLKEKALTDFDSN